MLHAPKTNLMGLAGVSGYVYNFEIVGENGAKWSLMVSVKVVTLF